jgi:hypothetical protein
VGEPVAPLIGADSRPRIYIRLMGFQPYYAAHPAGQWRPCNDITDAIDAVAGPNAWQRDAVIIWQGTLKEEHQHG